MRSKNAGNENIGLDNQSYLSGSEQAFTDSRLTSEVKHVLSIRIIQNFCEIQFFSAGAGALLLKSSAVPVKLTLFTTFSWFQILHSTVETF